MPRAIVPYDDIAGPSRSSGSARAAQPQKRKRAASRAAAADGAAPAQPPVRRAPPGVWAPSSSVLLQLRPGLDLDDDDAELPDSLRPLAPPEYAYEAVAPAAPPAAVPPQPQLDAEAAGDAPDAEMDNLEDSAADAEGGEWDEEEEWYEEGEEGEEWYGEEEEEEEEEDDGSRPLPHADIWDEDSLVGAWNASVADYEAFRLRRAFAGAAPTGAPTATGATLWHHAPAPDSRAARNAHVEGKAYAERRKREGKENDEVRREEKRMQQTQAAEVDASAIDTAIEAAAVPGDAAAEALRVATAAAAEASRLSTAMQARAQLPAASATNGLAKSAKPPKKPRGVVPPSASLPGSAAWHAACATVSKTPNVIAGVPNGEASTSPSTSSALASPAPALPRPPSDGPDVETLQNLANAWYYAGYYQAMATRASQQ